MTVDELLRDSEPDIINCKSCALFIVGEIRQTSIDLGLCLVTMSTNFVLWKQNRKTYGALFKFCANSGLTPNDKLNASLYTILFNLTYENHCPY